MPTINDSLEAQARRTSAHVMRTATLNHDHEQHAIQLRQLLGTMEVNALQTVEAAYGDPTCTRDTADARLARFMGSAISSACVAFSPESIWEHLLAKAAVALLHDRVRRAELRIAASGGYVRR
jgi:hypothetical protein